MPTDSLPTSRAGAATGFEDAVTLPEPSRPLRLPYGQAFCGPVFGERARPPRGRPKSWVQVPFAPLPSVAAADATPTPSSVNVGLRMLWQWPSLAIQPAITERGVE